MRYEHLYLAGYGVHLPPAMSAAEALQRGLCEPELVAQNAMASVTVSAGESGPELAVPAARQALARAGAGPADIDLVLHAAAYHQGHDIWSSASYVQRMALGNRCAAIDVRQTSNGGLAALELAAGYLLARPGRRAALLTCGDRFCAPGFDRWRTDPGTVFADGGAAIVLDTGHGFARVRSLVTLSDPELEPMHRGDDPFGPAPLSARTPIDLGHTTGAYLRTVGSSFAVARMAAGQGEAVKTALAEAGVDLADVDRFVLPNFGERRMSTGFFRRLGVPPERTTWPWGRTVGHLGAGDQFAGLAHLVDSGQLGASGIALLLGVGCGFVWSCAVVEVRHRPAWV